MPGLNGLGVLKHTRSVATEIPVLLMSGFSYVEIEEIIKQGAEHFIVKSLDLDVLLFKIRRALNPKYQ